MVRFDSCIVKRSYFDPCIAHRMYFDLCVVHCSLRTTYQRHQQDRLTDKFLTNKRRTKITLATAVFRTTLIRTNVIDRPLNLVDKFPNFPQNWITLFLTFWINTRVIVVAFFLVKTCSLPDIPFSSYIAQPANYNRTYNTGDAVTLACKKGFEKQPGSIFLLESVSMDDGKNSVLNAKVTWNLKINPLCLKDDILFNRHRY